MGTNLKRAFVVGALVALIVTTIAIAKVFQPQSEKPVENRLAWHAQEAKAKGLSAVQLPAPYEFHAEVTDINLVVWIRSGVRVHAFQ